MVRACTYVFITMFICSSERRALARTKVSSFSSHSPFQSGIPPLVFYTLRSQSCAHFDRPGPNRGCIKDGGKFVLVLHVGITHGNINFIFFCENMVQLQIRGVDIDFPFPPYDCQVSYMEKVIHCLQEVSQNSYD